MEYIASQLISANEIIQLREAFIEFDKDGDRKLSIEELKIGFGLANFSKADINSIIEHCNYDVNGFIEYTEFLASTLNWKKKIDREKLVAVLKAFDIDNSEAISLLEMKQFFGDSGVTIEDEA